MRRLVTFLSTGLICLGALAQEDHGHHHGSAPSVNADADAVNPATHQGMNHGGMQQPGVDEGGIDHNGMDHGASHGDMSHGTAADPASAQAGAWPYAARPRPAVANPGVTMVPVPGYGHMFIDANGVDATLRCAAQTDPRVMVDRATREGCGVAAAVSAPTADTHVHH